MIRSNRLITTAFILFSGETLGLTSSNSGIRLPFVSPTKSTGLASKFRGKKGTEIGFRRYNSQPKTCLTSTYNGARGMTVSLSWLPSFFRKGARRVSKLLQRKRSRRLLYSVILACIVVLAPAFSPARATSTAAPVTERLSPVTPFSNQSRALGTFNMMPTKAEMELCFRLLYAACAGAFVGMERSTSADRPAGVRTMALVGLGSCIYTICSTHGFLPHSALGYAPGSPYLAGVKCDLSRMAANIASGVGFIGAGAIHKSKLHGDGTESQNVVAGLTTAAAIWVSAAVGIASAVGLYSVGAVATFSTVAILKYARIPKGEGEEPGFSWKPRPLDVVDKHHGQRQHSPQVPSHAKQDAVSGLFGKQVVTDYDPQQNAFVEEGILGSYSKDAHPIIVKEVIDPRFEQFLRSTLYMDMEVGHALDEKEVRRQPKVLIEEEQEVVSSNVTTKSEDASIEP